MITKMANAALITFYLATSALAAETIVREGDTVVMNFSGIDLATAAGRTHVLQAVKCVARKVCDEDHVGPDNAKCVGRFTREALAGIANPLQRDVMLDAYAGRDDDEAAVAEFPRRGA